MNCVHVISGDLWAGAEVAMFNMACDLARRPRVVVEAIVLNHGTLANRLRGASIRTHVIEEARHGFVGLAKTCLERLDGRPVDVVHSHRYKENLLGAVLAAARGAFHVRTIHGLSPPLGSGRAALAALLDSAVADWTGSTWVAVSRDLASTIQGMRRTIHVIPNGLPHEPPLPNRQVLDAAFESGPGWYVGFVGRLEAVKRPDRFLRIVARLPRYHAGREVRAVVVGEGSLRGSLCSEVARSKNTPPVRFLGHLDDGEAVVGALDVLVICSDHEGHPMVLLEAMRSGVPVAGTAVGGLNEVLGTVPWLVPKDDEGRLARAVVGLLTEPTRAAWSRALQRMFTERFTIPVTGSRLVQLYSSALPDATSWK